MSDRPEAPGDDDYGPLVGVTLHLWGDNLIPDDMTAKLGIQPTHARRKGDRVSEFSDPRHKTKTGHWAFSSDCHTESPDLDDHVAIFLTTFGGKADAMRSDPTVRKSQVSILVLPGYRPGKQSWEGAICREVVEIAGIIGAEIMLTVSWSTSPDD